MLQKLIILAIGILFSHISVADRNVMTPVASDVAERVLEADRYRPYFNVALRWRVVTIDVSAIRDHAEHVPPQRATRPSAPPPRKPTDPNDGPVWLNLFDDVRINVAQLKLDENGYLQSPQFRSNLDIQKNTTRLEGIMYFKNLVYIITPTDHFTQTTPVPHLVVEFNPDLPGAREFLYPALDDTGHSQKMLTDAGYRENWFREYVENMRENTDLSNEEIEKMVDVLRQDWEKRARLYQEEKGEQR